MSIEDKILDLNFQRKAAKTALGVSMGITALTALNMNSRMSQLHKISGLVMLASAIWHAGLYGSPYSEFLQNRKAKSRGRKRSVANLVLENLPDGKSTSVSKKHAPKKKASRAQKRLAA
ncbi:hypothetical protein [uncultured Campylobacter sp.]|uniref:hypothetical protein n=1 Tax=uncultured Campylobacter sp. TaxID=218934 RepID=UPI0026098137|nr:hypothetical protein [uncultured Campylobacter sp.]